MWNMTGEHDRGNASMLAGQDCYRDENGARFAGPIGEKSPFHQLPCPDAQFRVVGEIASYRQFELLGVD
jgi:hypothetical protein